ncbi:glycoside hydrolase family 76 protein [Ophiostoma piceae UAMH 11346]|uniref:Mannan endo-1,6-alpha-mannosidase n=1 Tax=Ophiostoma piceae (strain UAMH 11346) TaxID=1262450 RepID=S3CB37_OPHP1|nr:glycoside hydrolase family 76 protein [Ophiostoma piceae UAMH 11346]
MLFAKRLLCAAALASTASAQITVDLTDSASIKTAMATIAYNLLTYYKGNMSGMTPGILPGPPPDGDYYWWEGGAMWGTMVDYWHYTNDTSYNPTTEYSIVFQAGSPDNSFQPANWTASLGNDDQGFWGMSAMLAAETNFDNPPADGPQWLALAQAVFNTQAARWDTKYCEGGLRWQVPLSNNGYNYKNSIANGIFFNLAARLARYTGNATYADWAAKTYNWTEYIGYIDTEYNIYDGGHVEHNCTDINKAQFSYVAAVYIQGAAFMYNYTNGDSFWQSRLTALTNRTLNVFFPNDIAVELSCELTASIQCTTDMLSYKGYLHRWLAQVTQMAPYIHDTIMPVLKTSATAAMKNCNADGTCGFRWTTTTYDGDTGAGQQMNALGALMSVLLDLEYVSPAYTNTTGGTSVGNSAAGTDSSTSTTTYKAITTSDRAGATIITILICASIVSMLMWMSTGENESLGGFRFAGLFGKG